MSSAAAAAEVATVVTVAKQVMVEVTGAKSKNRKNIIYFC